MESNDIFYYGAIAFIFLFIYYKKSMFASVKSIDAQTAISMIKENKNIILIDVRTKSEYKQSRLAKAVFMPLSNLSKDLNKLDNTKQILVYCQSGGRSVSASKILEKNGFDYLNISGGIMALRANGADLRTG